MSSVGNFFKKIIVLGAVGVILIALFVPSRIFFNVFNPGLERGCSYSIVSMASPLAAFCDVDASSISFNVDAYDEQESINHDQVLQARFDQALARFKRTKDYGESSLQNVIDLLGYELKLVRLLFYGNTGAVIDYALEARDMRLEYSIPSVILVYRAILDLVTYNSNFNPILIKQCQNDKQLALALNHDKRRAFLFEMETKLMQYQNSMRQLQYEIALDTSIDVDNPQPNNSTSKK